MPTYSYKCDSCQSVLDDIVTIAHRNDPRKCPECGGEMKLKIVPVRINPILGAPGFPGYECPVSGEYVTSRKRRKEIMKEHNITEKE